MITLIEEKILGADAQTLDFDATLAGDTDKGYTIIAYIDTGPGGTANLFLRLNESTALLGHTQALLAFGLVTNSSRLDDDAIGATIGSDSVVLTAEIPKSDTGGARHVIVNETRQVGAACSINKRASDITTPAVGTEITSAGIGASVANSLGSGSIFRLYKWS
jgi:hypothetical protein